ncbi:MAG: rhamnan synthesis F family protein [Candidatus Pacearchaeota archaeon]|jgi:CMP-N-acetylneuraminic acid synthetase|nr:hypothetical protein [Clostridia bacterium]
MSKFLVDDNFIILIPARKGSKGLPFKNRRLLDYTLNSIPSFYINKVWVSTDDEYIQQICESKGVKVHRRTESSATDNASTKTLVNEFIATQRIQSTIIMLYLTYPERTWEDIQNAYAKLRMHRGNSLLCKKDVKQSPYLMMIEKNALFGEQVIKHDLYRRQDYPKVFEISHFVAIFEPAIVSLLNQNLYYPNTIFHKINDTIDVDTAKDLDAFISANPIQISKEMQMPYIRTCKKENGLTFVDGMIDNSILPKNTKKIKIYYHIGLIDDSCIEIINDQIKTLKDTGIYDAANKILYSVVGNIKLLPKLPKKFECVYKSENISDAEMPILEILRNDSQTEDFKCIYFHTKGSSSRLQNYDANKLGSWRKYMEHFVFDHWERNMSLLEKYDTVGTSMILGEANSWYKDHYAGNFWCANSSYIKKLNSLNETYTVTGRDRYKAEMWILSDSNVKAFNYHAFHFTPFCKHYFDPNAYEIPVVKESKAKIAVLMHLYYIDLVKEFIDSIKNIKYPSDVYVTIPDNTSMLETMRLKKIFKDSDLMHKVIFITAGNIGMDIGPTFLTMKEIAKNNMHYDYYLKIHTKKSIDPGDINEARIVHGEVWRNALIQPLCGSEDNVMTCINCLNAPDVGMVGSNKWRITFNINEWYTKQNLEIIKQYATKLNWSNWETTSFFIGGTMFWVKGDLWEKFFEEINIDETYSKFNKGKSNDKNGGTHEHSMERIFGIYVCQNKLKIQGV